VTTAVNRDCDGGMTTPYEEIRLAPVSEH